MSCFPNLLRYHQLLNTHTPALHALLRLDQLLARREEVPQQNRRRTGVWTLGEQYMHGHTRIATGTGPSGAPCASFSDHVGHRRGSGRWKKHDPPRLHHPYQPPLVSPVTATSTPMRARSPRSRLRCFPRCLLLPWERRERIRWAWRLIDQTKKSSKWW
jgi:hypothetical protein